MRTQIALNEKLRSDISNYLTKILVLFSRLDPDAKTRNLPDTIHEFVKVVRRLEQLEHNYPEFVQIFAENIEIREKHSKVFIIPNTILNDPSLNGIKNALTLYLDPLVKRYSVEQQQFVKNELRNKKDISRKRILLENMRNDCKMMGQLCSAHNIPVFNNLITWCEMELSGLG